jgi:hypothetical protein
MSDIVVAAMLFAGVVLLSSLILPFVLSPGSSSGGELEDGEGESGCNCAHPSAIWYDRRLCSQCRKTLPSRASRQAESQDRFASRGADSRAARVRVARGQSDTGRDDGDGSGARVPDVDSDSSLDVGDGVGGTRNDVIGDDLEIGDRVDQQQTAKWDRSSTALNRRLLLLKLEAWEEDDRSNEDDLVKEGGIFLIKSGRAPNGKTESKFQCNRCRSFIQITKRGIERHYKGKTGDQGCHSRPSIGTWFVSSSDGITTPTRPTPKSQVDFDNLGASDALDLLKNVQNGAALESSTCAGINMNQFAKFINGPGALQDLARMAEDEGPRKKNGTLRGQRTRR